MKKIEQIIEAVNDGQASTQHSVSRVVQAKLHSYLNEMLSMCSDIIGAMVSNSDGLAWSQQLQAGLDPHRFAAMSSALLALSDNLMRETNQGTPKNVLIESDSGNIFVMHAGTNLLLTIFTSSTTNLGMPLAYAKKAADEIAAMNINFN